MKKKIWVTIMIAIVVGLSAKIKTSPEKFVERWSDINLDNRFSDLKVSLNVPNTDYTKGLLLIRAEVSYNDFNAFRVENKFYSAPDVTFSPPERFQRKLWWNPPSNKRPHLEYTDWFVRPVDGHDYYWQQIYWHDNKMYFFQTGAFDAFKLIPGSYSKCID